MAPLSDDELVEARAFGVKAVIVAAVSTPTLIIVLHFFAAALRVDFSVVKEGEIIIACFAVVGAVARWAFTKPQKKKLCDRCKKLLMITADIDDEDEHDGATV